MPTLSASDLMRLTPECVCCHGHNTRIILASTAWNESGTYLFHCLDSGQITPIADIEMVIRDNIQEDTEDPCEDVWMVG